MNRTTSLLLAALVCATAPAVEAQSSAPLMLVDSNGTAIGRMAGYGGGAASWVAVDVGTQTAMVELSPVHDGNALEFDSTGSVSFDAAGCSGTPYLTSDPTPGALPSAVQSFRTKLLLFVADSFTTSQATFYSYLYNGHCRLLRRPSPGTGYRVSSSPINLGSFTAPFYVH